MMALTLFLPKRAPRSRSFVASAIAVCVVICVAVLLYKWPFNRREATAALQHEFGNSVHIDSFQTSFWPPGYVAQNITYPGNGEQDSMARFTIRRIELVASPLDLLLMRKRVKRILIEGLRLTLPQASATSHKLGPPRFSEIGLFEARDAVIKFPSSQSDSDPLTFSVKSSTFNGISETHSGSFSVDLTVNKPHGAIHLSGAMGPWNWNKLGNTPISGSFSLPHADLSNFAGVHGALNASGRFAGPLRQVICNGSAAVPDFQVSESSHSVNLSTTFRASINGLNGDVVLENAKSHFNRTVIESQGCIKQDPQRAGKTASLRLSVQEGQVGDVLLLFTRAPQPAMTGTVDLRLNVEVPPGPRGFLQKLTFSGDFGIDRGRFTKAKAQTPINDLSESAAGLGPAARKASHGIVLSDVAGHISGERGLATLSGISFSMPGSHGVISGTYDLINQALDLGGRLLTKGELSSAASGIKAVMLKVVTPFLTRHSETAVGFTITGTAEHPHFALDLMKKPGA